MEGLTHSKILEAYKVLRESVNHTPLQYDKYLSDKYQAKVYLKREDLQAVRSFKLRGAYYAIDQLTQDDLDRGVICASAGNHAQGVAYTCKLKEVPSTIFMPTTTPKQKIDQVKYFGGDFVEIKIQEDTFDKCNKAAHEYGAEHGLTFIEPFNDPNVMLGQGTVAVEIHQDLVAQGEEADYVLVPIGGGGLVSGVSTYVKGNMKGTKIIGVEPKGAASMQAALAEGHPVELTEVDKFCDGTAVAEIGELTYRQSKDLIDRVEVVPEGKVSGQILELYSKQAIVAEPSGALSVAALDQMKDDIKGKTVVAVISGGNNDISRMGEIEELWNIYRGLQQYFVVQFPQRAGALKEFVTHILNEGDDITRFEYTKKVNRTSGPVFVGVLLGDYANLQALLERLEEFDPNFINVTNNKSLYQLLV